MEKEYYYLILFGDNNYLDGKIKAPSAAHAAEQALENRAFEIYGSERVKVITRAVDSHFQFIFNTERVI